MFERPIYFVLFFVLMTPLAIISTNLRLGTDGLFVAIVVAIGGAILVPQGMRVLHRYLADSRDGRPSMLEFLMAPPGYHEERQLAAIEAQSNVPMIEAPRERQEQIAVHSARDPRGRDARLYLAENFNPDIDELVGEGIVGFGSKGSGKTNLGALLAEQFGRFLIPMVVFDLEGDYLSLVEVLPRGMVAGHPDSIAQGPGTLALTSENARSVGWTILEQGYQAVVSLQSFASDEEAARVIVGIIDGLTDWANAQSNENRVPCLLFLDEAAHWLPQDTSASSLAKETLQLLQRTFIETVARGRKRGLTPVLFSQRISEVDKRVIAQAGVYFLMKQRLDIDLARYMKIARTEVATEQDIAAFAPGQGVVSLPDGEQFITRFNQRASRHVSHTPKAERAYQRYARQTTEPIETMSIPETPRQTEIPETPRYPIAVQVKETVPLLSSRPAPGDLLQRAVEAYARGNQSYRTLGAALGIDKDAAGRLIRQMKERRLIA